MSNSVERSLCRCTRESQLARLGVLAGLALGLGAFQSLAVAGFAPNNLWNLRENAEDRFHSNEAIVRPWRFSFDDGVGKYVGNFSYDIPWTDQGATGDGTGGFAISRGRDHQFSAWTFVYMQTAGMVTVTGGGDCVPRLYWDLAFDDPHTLPTAVFLTQGWHRLDITGYNQNDGYNAVFPRPDGVTFVHRMPVPVCRGDANNDLRVDFLDLNFVLSDFGLSAAPGTLSGDVNGDGVVNLIDLNEVLSFYGQECASQAG